MARAVPAAVAGLFPSSEPEEPYQQPYGLPKFTLLFDCDGACGKMAAAVCTGCHKARFCGADCQRASWSGHKAACRERAAALGITPSMDWRARQRAADAFDFPTASMRFSAAVAEHNEPRKLVLYELAVEAGSEDAAVTLADIYAHGRFGAPRSPRLAFETLLRAGELGSEQSTVDAAGMLIEGAGVPVDIARGRAMLERLTTRAVPHASAATVLGALIKAGNAPGLSSARAVELFAASARGGHAEGEYNYGLSFYMRAEFGDSDSGRLEDSPVPLFPEGRTRAEKFGKCGPQTAAQRRDYAEAAKWFTRAAAQGQKNAAHNLGNIFESGLGVAKDGARARELFKQALRAGYLPAAIGYAGLLLRGEGGAADYGTALEVLREAAGRGCAQSRAILDQIVAAGPRVRFG